MERCQPPPAEMCRRPLEELTGQISKASGRHHEERRQHCQHELRDDARRVTRRGSTTPAPGERSRIKAERQADQFAKQQQDQKHAALGRASTVSCWRRDAVVGQFASLSARGSGIS